jgi:hypothetical protein
LGRQLALSSLVLAMVENTQRCHLQILSHISCRGSFAILNVVWFRVQWTICLAKMMMVFHMSKVMKANLEIVSEKAGLYFISK